ncbi:MAG: hypothetical protein K8963_09340 [Proteobacteria bacterium]|nr:hypothetical protein [Pseudomonadota bacterium]
MLAAAPLLFTILADLGLYPHRVGLIFNAVGRLAWRRTLEAAQTGMSLIYRQNQWLHDLWPSYKMVALYEYSLAAPTCQSAVPATLPDDDLAMMHKPGTRGCRQHKRIHSFT